jgi:hypothetical protein
MHTVQGRSRPLLFWLVVEYAADRVPHRMNNVLIDLHAALIRQANRQNDKEYRTVHVYVLVPFN